MKTQFLFYWLRRFLFLCVLGLFWVGRDFQPFFIYEDCEGVSETVKGWTGKVMEYFGKVQEECVPQYVPDTGDIYWFAFIVVIGMFLFTFWEDRVRRREKKN